MENVFQNTQAQKSQEIKLQANPVYTAGSLIEVMIAVWLHLSLFRDVFLSLFKDS